MAKMPVLFVIMLLLLLTNAIALRLKLEEDVAAEVEGTAEINRGGHGGSGHSGHSGGHGGGGSRGGYHPGGGGGSRFRHGGSTRSFGKSSGYGDIFQGSLLCVLHVSFAVMVMG